MFVWLARLPTYNISCNSTDYHPTPVWLLPDSRLTTAWFPLNSCPTLYSRLLANSPLPTQLFPPDAHPTLDYCTMPTRLTVVLWRSLTRSICKTARIEDTKGGEWKLKKCNSQKSNPFTSVDRPPFTGRQTNFYISKITLYETNHSRMC
jgi:hypothetical protein